MLKKGMLILILVIFGLACAPSAAAVEKAIQKTQTAALTPPPSKPPVEISTPQPSPTSALAVQPTQPPAPAALPAEQNLPSLLSHSEDLPPGYQFGSLGSVPAERYTWITDRGIASHLLSIETADNNVAAYVTVFVYDDKLTPILAYMEDLDEVMRLIKDHGTTYTFHFTTIDEVGEKDLAYVLTAASGSEKSIALGFVRCNLYVRVSFSTTDDQAMTIAYAQKLDQRLIASACSE